MNHETLSEGRALLSKQAGVRNVAIRVAAALISLSLAYIAARWLMVELTGGGIVAVSRLSQELLLFLVFATVALILTSAVPIRNDLMNIHRLVESNENELRARSRSQAFLRRTQSSFEMADYEAELFEVAGLALTEAGPGRAEILVADASNAHVERVAVAIGRNAPGCGVTTPKSCPAVRQGHTLKFGEPNGLGACPRLRERQFADSAVATCVPINVLGAPAAVLHAVCDEAMSRDEMANGVTALEGVGLRFGHRLGMIRAMAQSRHQADTDPLTGLLNRRALENQVRNLRSDHVPFALAMVDLDHFKSLNDTYGHDTGDRALRLFARVMTTAMRDDDLVCRHGGEEFVIVLPGADVVTAAPVLHRLRERLAETLAGAQLPAFTASLGLTDSSAAEDLPELLETADRALMLAKEQGRDRIVIADTDDAPADRHGSADPTASASGATAPSGSHR